MFCQSKSVIIYPWEELTKSLVTTGSKNTSSSSGLGLPLVIRSTLADRISGSASGGGCNSVSDTLGSASWDLGCDERSKTREGEGKVGSLHLEG